MSSVVENRKNLVPEFIKNIKPYQAGKPIDELAREKGLTKISKLASNENPLGPSPFAIKEMTQALWDVHNYPDMNAFRLKASLAELYKVKQSNIILGSGSEGIFSYVSRAFMQPGDEILTSENTFIGFMITAQTMGANVKTVPMTPDFRFDVEAIAKAITPQTKIIYIANPNNPTGTYITKEEFDFLMKFVPDYVMVILDEAYFEFANDFINDFPDSMKYRYDNQLTCRTFSKAYGLAGVRIGYGFAHEDLIVNLHKVKPPFEPNLIAQVGACGAIYDRPHLKRTLENNRIQHKRTYDFLKEMKMNPIESITNFIMFKTGSSEASEFLYQSLLNTGVIIRPLKGMGLPDFARISIGNEEEMNHFFDSMKTIYPDYNKKFGKIS